jgi:hypothetical protein
MSTAAVAKPDPAGVVTIAFARERTVRIWQMDPRSAGAPAAFELGSTETPITVVALNHSGTQAVTVNDKAIILWSVAERRAIWQVITPKRASAATFDGARVLFADKFGEVWTLAESAGVPQDAAAATRTIPAGPEPAFELGVVSEITTMLLSPEPARRLVTADADKRIRVSPWPGGFEIESFCMGSTTVPLSLALSRSRATVLFSAGDDGVLHAWDPATGAQLSSARPADDFPQAPLAAPEAAPAPEPLAEWEKAGGGPSAGSARAAALCADVGDGTLLALALAGSAQVLIYEYDSSSSGGATLRPKCALDVGHARGSVCALHTLPSERGSCLWAICSGGDACVFEMDGSSGAFRQEGPCHAL